MQAASLRSWDFQEGHDGWVYNCVIFPQTKLTSSAHGPLFSFTLDFPLFIQVRLPQRHVMSVTTHWCWDLVAQFIKIEFLPCCLWENEWRMRISLPCRMHNGSTLAPWGRWLGEKPTEVQGMGAVTRDLRWELISRRLLSPLAQEAVAVGWMEM